MTAVEPPLSAAASSRTVKICAGRKPGGDAWIEFDGTRVFLAAPQVEHLVAALLVGDVTPTASHLATVGANTNDDAEDASDPTPTRIRADERSLGLSRPSEVTDHPRNKTANVRTSALRRHSEPSLPTPLALARRTLKPAPLASRTVYRTTTDDHAAPFLNPRSASSDAVSTSDGFRVRTCALSHAQELGVSDEALRALIDHPDEEWVDADGQFAVVVRGELAAHIELDEPVVLAVMPRDRSLRPKSNPVGPRAHGGSGQRYPTRMKDLRAMLTDIGCEIELRPSGHYRVRWNGAFATLPATPSDHRALLNAVKALERRLGIDITTLWADRWAR